MTSAAETIGNNHTDLLTQILVRLPTKTLLELKCVSKLWFSLISSPYFCLCHTRHNQTNGFLAPTDLLLDWYRTLPMKIEVIQSCYGLFLCKSVVDDISSYFVCNPTTKKFKKLFFPREPLEEGKSYVSMAFDPLKSPHYKIICNNLKGSHKHPLKYEMDIYSSETDSWSLSRISFEVELEKYIAFEEAIFCNGKIHWNCCGEDSLYFDVENERLETLPLPISRRDMECSHLGECRGVLCIAVTYYVFDVFEMTSDYSHWFLKYRLHIGDLLQKFPAERPGYLTLFPDMRITQFEKEQEAKIVVGIQNKIYLYDLRDGTWNLMPGKRLNLRIYRSIHASLYFENLSSIC